jgi:hypothetical protein
MWLEFVGFETGLVVVGWRVQQLVWACGGTWRVVYIFGVCRFRAWLGWYIQTCHPGLVES